MCNDVRCGGRAVSQMHGLFSLRTPQDLLGKLESDFGRFEGAQTTSVEAQYAAFDFFVTALHMADWVATAAGDPASSHRDYPDGALVDDLGNGAKHFRVDARRHTTVSDTGSVGYFDPAFFDPTYFEVARLVIELEDGSTVDALDVARRVLDHRRNAL